MNLLSDNEETNIIFKSINSYVPGETDFFILISTFVFEEIINIVKKNDMKIDSQDIYDSVSDCFNHYNAFVKEKKMNLPLIAPIYYDYIVEIINDEMNNMSK